MGTDDEKIDLKEYFEGKFEANDKATNLAFEALKVRLESIDRVAELTRSTMGKDIQELRESRSNLEGKASNQSVMMSYVIAVISILISIISFMKR